MKKNRRVVVIGWKPGAQIAMIAMHLTQLKHYLENTNMLALVQLLFVIICEQSQSRQKV